MERLKKVERNLKKTPTLYIDVLVSKNNYNLDNTKKMYGKT